MAKKKTSKQMQDVALRSMFHIVVVTPGDMIDHLRSSKSVRVCDLYHAMYMIHASIGHKVGMMNEVQDDIAHKTKR
ncbi:hypothetical protein GIB67_028094 [Kingdonia uniflora]|uniref:Uncharacterized protein n=1 Tax=Kingdonia uniflora TaxID=39325 RepID=A0A7J7NR25_9MAGN|nr:hypothetical protein GIB67_028094 [Kingdonia uniflora]